MNDYRLSSINTRFIPLQQHISQQTTQQPMLLKEIRKQCEQQGLLHLAHYRHNKSISIDEWLRRFINEWNYEKDTLNSNEEVDTESGKRRSLGDIYRIAKTYYPTLKLKELVASLYSIRGGINDSWCNTIKKHVFYRKSDGIRRNSEENNFGDSNNPTVDEYGRTLSSYLKIKKK